MKENIKVISRLIIRISPLVLFSPVASAYVGPGAGLSAIGSIIALVGSFFLLILGFLWYPLKRVFRRKNRLEQESDDVAVNSLAPDEVAGAAEEESSGRS
jgi:hypothetical protein